MLDDALAQLRDALREELSQAARAHDSSPQPLPSSTPPETPSTPVARAVVAVASAARAAEIPPERVVIEVKSVWETLADVERGVPAMTLRNLRQELITSVIKAYYLQ